VTALTPWLLEPRDLLVVRDARPAKGTNRMRSLRFPSSATVAGCVRTQLGAGADGWASVLQLEVAGPWLVDLVQSEILCPAPRDCFWSGTKADRRFNPLRPSLAPDGLQSNLPDGLRLVQAVGGHDASKAVPGPAFWRWSAMEAWLLGREPDQSAGPDAALSTEERTHVAIDREAGTARDAALFSVEGLRFGDLKTRYALGFAVGGARAETLQPGLVRLGGEGHMSRLSRAGALPPLTEALATRLACASGVWRVVLLTPGIFEAGWRPSEARIRACFGETAILVAACVDRPQVLSGWDFVGEGRPKKSRRAAPAGSVYWIEGVTKPPGEAWMASLCDDEQDRRDGFGRMLLGVG